MSAYSRKEAIARLEQEWSENPRWKAITRTYTAEDVVRLRAGNRVDILPRDREADGLWQRLNREGCNDQGDLPIADARIGRDGALGAYGQVRTLIETGVGGIALDDTQGAVRAETERQQRVLIPTLEVQQALTAARLAADVCAAAPLIIAHTVAIDTTLLTSDSDDHDKPFCTGECTEAGLYRVRSGITAATARGLAYAPYADVVGLTCTHLDLDAARAFAEAIHARHPGKPLAFCCSPTTPRRERALVDNGAALRHSLSNLGYRIISLRAHPAAHLKRARLPARVVGLHALGQAVPPHSHARPTDHRLPVRRAL